MENLQKRMEAEIEKASFNLFELTGFKVNPKLALLAGMAIGYRMGLDDAVKQKP